MRIGHPNTAENSNHQKSDGYKILLIVKQYRYMCTLKKKSPMSMGCVRCDKNAKKMDDTKACAAERSEDKREKNAGPGSLVHPVSSENAIGCK
jgi:hypothetical protein